MRIGDVDFSKAVIEGPWVTLRRSAVHHDDQRPLTTQEIDQELEEGVDRKGLWQTLALLWIRERDSAHLIDIPERVEVEGSCQRHDAAPRRSSIDWYPETH